MTFEDDTPSTPDDRRTRQREATHRAVEFVGSQPDQQWSQGTVIDISTGGLQIRARAAVPIGTSLELEVYASDALQGTPLRSQGRVAWVLEQDNGYVAMGVRVMVQLEPEALPVVQGRISSDPLPGISDVNAMAPTVRYTEAEDDSEEYVPPIIPWRRILPVLLLFLLFALFFQLMHSIQFNDKATTKTTASQTETPLQPLDQKPGAALPTEAPDPTLAPPAPRGHLGVAMLLDQAESSIQIRDWEAAETAFRKVLEDENSSDGERTLAGIGEIGAVLSQGNTAKAGAILADLDDVPGFQDSPWTEVLEDLIQAMAKNPDVMPEALGFHNSLALEPDPATPAEQGKGRRILINTAQHRLTVMDGEDALATFPVGLGRGDTTPAGTFRIVNKLESPDWYNKGDVVLAGDPENPLGDFWMGLGLGIGGPNIPIGIHPTEEQDSIGKNCSAGCIRMLPGDAAEVFALCEVGTPVYISP